MIKSMEELFRLVILLNEVSGNLKAILRFSDPDGPSGRSGWSFGLCQFDTKHNDAALACLHECGCTESDIHSIVNQLPGSKELASKLKADIVARYDQAQLSRCLYSALNVTTSKGIVVVDTAAILALADYVNQYGSIGNQFADYLNACDLDKPVDIHEIQKWKLTTKYGKEHPDDCNRRYNNILSVLKKEGINI